MFTAVFFLLLSLASTNAENLNQQVRLTRVATAAQTEPQSEQRSERQFFPVVTKPIEYRIENQMPLYDNVYRFPNNGDQGSFQHNPNHNHQFNHHHDHIQNYPESGQLGGARRNIYPSVMPTNANVLKMNQTTERYNRNAQPNNNYNRSPASNSNMDNRRSSKDHQMLFPSDKDISKVFGNPPPSQTPNVKPLNPSAPSKNCTFGLCDEVADYPEERILRIIENSRDLKQYFTNIASNAPDFILNRFGDDENALCSTMVHTQFPRSAPNTDNEEKILVNVGEFKQGIVYETCANAGNPCKFAEAFPNDITTSCKQKYTVRRLMVVGKDSDKAVFDNFHLPSCCVCVTKKN